MATITNQIKFSTNIEELKRDIGSGITKIVAMKDAVNRTAERLGGGGLLKAANQTSAAIIQLGGASKLTAAEQAKANTLLTKAIDKYRVLGKTAPPAMVALARATSGATQPTHRLRTAMERMKASITNSQFAIKRFAQVTSAAVVGALAFMVKSASDFESSFAGVRKTVEASEPEFAALAQGFRNMSKEIPVSVNELHKIGEAAGQLGIEAGSILEFTRVMADLGVATVLSSDEAAIALARFATVVQLPREEFENLGSAIVDLGNKLEVNEAEIVDFGQRIVAAGKFAGLSSGQILGIGAAMASVGAPAEAGGTAVQKVLNRITAAVTTSSKELQLFASTAGVSAQKFAAMWESDAGEAFTRFVEGLGRQGKASIQTLQNLGLSNERVIRSFTSLSSAGDKLRQSMAIGVTAFAQNIALAEEAQKRYNTFASQVVILRNIISDLAIAGGQLLLPVLRVMVGNLQDTTTETANVNSAIGFLAKGFTLAVKATNFLSATLSVVRIAFDQLLIALKSAAKGMVDFVLTTGPLLKLLPGVGAAVDLASLAMGNLAQQSLRLGEEIKGLKAIQREEADASHALANEIDALVAGIEANAKAAKAGADMTVLQRRATVALDEALADATVTMGEASTRAAELASAQEGIVGGVEAAIKPTRDLSLGIVHLGDAMDSTARGPLPRFIGGIEDSFVGAVKTGEAAVKEFLDTWKHLEEGVSASVVSTPGFFGKITESFKGLAGDLNSVFQSAFEGGGGVGGAIKSLATRAVEGVLSAIPVIGPVLGKFAGAFVAGFKKLFGGRSVEAQISDIGKDLGLTLSEGMVKSIKEQGGDQLRGILFNLGGIIQEAGGVMAFGFAKAAAKAKDLFSLIDLGKANLAEIKPVFVDVFQQLVANLDQAGASGLWAFDQLVGAAQRFGISIDELANMFRPKFVEMAQQIDLLAERGIDDFRSLAQQARRLGLTAEDISGQFSEAFGRAVKKIDLLSENGVAAFIRLIAEGAEFGLTMQEAVAPVEAAMANLIGQVTAAGGIVPREFDAMIAKAQEMGLAGKHIAAFFEANWQKAIKGMTTALQSGMDLSKGTLQGFAAGALSIFQQMTDAGTPLIAALEALSPLWADLKQQMVDAGLKGTASFRAINGWMRLVSDKTIGPILRGVQGIGQAMEGLANTGALTQRQFNAFGRDVVKAFADMTSAGVTQRRALIAIQPTLQTLWEGQEKFGFTVDASTQKLIDQGIQAGVIGPQFRAAGDIMADAMGRVVTLLEALLTHLGVDIPAAARTGADGVTSAFSALDVKIKVGFDVDDANVQNALKELGNRDLSILGGRGGAGRARNFASGSGGFRDFGTGTPAILHGWERVQTPTQARAEMERGPRAGSPSLADAIETLRQENRALRRDLMRALPQAMFLAARDGAAQRRRRG